MTMKAHDTDSRHTSLALLTPIGTDTLQPSSDQPVATTASPRWAGGEAVWRVLNVLRSVQSLALSTTTPVAAMLNRQDSDTLTTALFPATLQALLRANENTIVASGQPWVGANNPPMSEVPPFPGVQSAHAGPSGIR